MGKFKQLKVFIFTRLDENKLNSWAAWECAAECSRSQQNLWSIGEDGAKHLNGAINTVAIANKTSMWIIINSAFLSLRPKHLRHFLSSRFAQAAQIKAQIHLGRWRAWASEQTKLQNIPAASTNVPSILRCVKKEFCLLFEF